MKKWDHVLLRFISRIIRGASFGTLHSISTTCSSPNSAASAAALVHREMLPHSVVVALTHSLTHSLTPANLTPSSSAPHCWHLSTSRRNPTAAPKNSENDVVCAAPGQNRREAYEVDILLTSQFRSKIHPEWSGRVQGVSQTLQQNRNTINK